MLEETERQAIVDGEHLRLLSIGFMISAAMNALMALAGLAYVAMGVFMGHMASSFPQSGKNPGPPPTIFFWFFGIIGGLMFLGAIVFGALKLRAAFCLKQRKSRTFCMVIAAISCLEIPYGTVLGVFSFIVLGRHSVIRLFGDLPAAPPSFQASIQPPM